MHTRHPDTFGKDKKAGDKITHYIVDESHNFSNHHVASLQSTQDIYHNKLVMAPDRDTLLASYNVKNTATNHQKPSRLSMDTLQRTISDISFELSKEVEAVADQLTLPPISEVEDAKCECCGMCEECTPEYIARVREKFLGKLICGLCSEAVKEEMEKSGGKIEEALSEHTKVCVRFNRFDRTNPVLFQAAAMKEMLKKSSRLDGSRAKSISPRDHKRGYGNVNVKGGLTRSSSCIPSITREMTEREVVNS
ncbi:hypothetical protein L2E82_28056 [Cichorium intybus]|uniref:Uncharacterized protein n=1 Tax=Cichorium intybus TaxID=13427 RepID=A0ACB9CUK4_CICIN|nr:hypothetical protein L2E82_28056 [Cichorium intybus]